MNKIKAAGFNSAIQEMRENLGSLAKSIRGAVTHLGKITNIVNDTLEDLEI